MGWTGPERRESAPGPASQIEVNWVFTVTHEMGAGYHIFPGRAFD